MPSWPGGPCPACGEEMPENLIHCQNCRALLNPELESDSVEIPPFIPLQEIEAMIDLEPTGVFVGCPHCDCGLRISLKYAGERVACKHCNQPFKFDPVDPALSLQAYFTNCPHCTEELRIAPKYLGMKLACKHCEGKIRFVEHGS